MSIARINVGLGRDAIVTVPILSRRQFRESRTLLYFAIRIDGQFFMAANIAFGSFGSPLTAYR